MIVGYLQHVQLFVFVAFLSFRATFVHSTNTSKCLGKERAALLKFKDELVDEYDRLSSWGDVEDCCKWTGIRCHNQTDNVIMLDLHGEMWDSAPLRGKISPWLLELQYMEYLDLSFNDFNYSGLPQFIGSLKRLKHLDLSNSNFKGQIPHHLGNLTALNFLILGSYYDLLSSTNLDWLSQLHSLRYLSLSFVNLAMATNWFQAINKLTRLERLELVACHPPNVLFPTPSMLNTSSSIYDLNLWGNELSASSIFPWLFNISAGSLRYLELGLNNLRGPIPDAIGNLVTLLDLSLEANEFEGGIPISLGNLSSLLHLDLIDNKLTGPIHRLALSSSLTRLELSNNMFNGSVPQSIGSLSKLETLDLSSNHFEGMIAESHFFSLTRLRVLILSDISLNFSLGWIPPFQLTVASLAGCKLGPHFPIWLRTQTELDELDISNTSIVSNIPDWFWELTQNMYCLNLSHNNLHGVLPDLSSKLAASGWVDLSFNHFNGSVPMLPSSAHQLDLSNNKLSGHVTNLCIETNQSINWVYLDISNNHLSGQLPKCLANLPPLKFLSLADNNFSGKIPSLNVISSLHLQNNGFSGEIPISLRNSASVTFIDLSVNSLSGKIPAWVGESWTKLVFLSLRSNQFSGTIPSNICHLALIQVLDLSLNKFFGDIPKCLTNLTALTREVNNTDQSFQVSIGFEMASVTWKGIELQYVTTLRLVKLIDLSSNNLIGDIPTGITSLLALVGLNLSRNNLSGVVPTGIGQLRSLDFLDLSRNHLEGDIPTSLSQLDQLGVLDLSYNNFSGKIPENIHLQTFSASSFEENLGLCGLPLLKACPGDEVAQDPKILGMKYPKEEDKIFDEGFYISMAVGFAFGFWGVCGALFFNKSVRNAFFKLWNRTMNWLYVKIMISQLRIRGEFR